MIYREASKNDLDKLLPLEQILYPLAEKNELENEFINLLSSPNKKMFICEDGNDLVAFVEIFLRNDYVEGSTTSPVAYIEGILVKPNFRHQGIAKKLAEMAEKWALQHGCTEIASDTETKNIESRVFHKKLGFEETNTIVCFIKKIGKQ